MRRLARRIVAIAHKEILHMIRDARVLYLALGMPVVMLAIFGYAVSTDVDRIPLAVVDQDATHASRELTEALVGGGAFVRQADLASAEEAMPLFRRGRIKAALVVPEGYARDLSSGVPTGAQLLVDGSDGTVATIAMGDAIGIVQSFSRAQSSGRGASIAGGPRIRTLFNPAMRSSYSIVPGVMAIILSLVSALLSALTVAREWERGSMEQLFATPVRRGEIVIGKLIPYASLGLVQALLIVTLGSYLFDVPIRGSLTVLFGSSALFLLGMLGIGLYVSVATKNQVVSVQFALMAAFLPSALLSGFLFPIENMPAWLRAVSIAVPARYYIAALRGVMLKGIGAGELVRPLFAMSAFALVIVSLAVAKFRRRLT